MRVLVLTADYPPRTWSGIGAAVQRQARALAALGVQVTVLVPDPDPAPDGAVEIRSLAGPRCPVDPRAYDLVHLHSLALAELAAELHRRFGLPLLYTAHALVDRELEPSPEAAFWAAVQARVLRLSQRAIFLSDAERDAAVARWPELASRSVVVPNGLALEPTPAPEPPPPSEGPLVFAGRFARSKGLRVLAAAMDRVFAEEPGARLVLAGGHGDGEGRRAVSDLARAHPGRCEVRGWLPQPALRSLFAGASAVLVPSLYEPFGQVALEAMAVGAPVLASAVGGLRQIAGPGSGGRLVEGHDPEDWARATLALLRSPSERCRLRRQGPAHVAAHFEISRVAGRLLREAYAA
ncbi:MAG TPA: glycosyltransferase family 4 protein [Myxococcaceae bacterium]